MLDLAYGVKASSGFMEAIPISLATPEKILQKLRRSAVRVWHGLQSILGFWRLQPAFQTSS